MTSLNANYKEVKYDWESPKDLNFSLLEFPIKI